jgi:hypothetical protein
MSEWTTCPWCDQDVFNSHNGWRRHTEFCRRVNLSRYAAMLAEHGMRPFHREPYVNERTGRVEPSVLGERPPFRWRVSRDEWRLLEAAAKGAWGWETAPTDSSQLAGFPIAPDDTLPPRSIVFELIHHPIDLRWP